MLSALVLIAIRSARLPGLSDPTFESTPIERAPSMVPSSSALRALILNSLPARAFSESRVSLSTAKRFDEPVSAEVSTEMPSGMPFSIISVVCG